MIRIECDTRGVATLTLARAQKRNAMDAQMIAELTEAAASLGADQNVRVVILAADGPVFCAGGDLAWMRAQMDANADARASGARALAHMLGALNTLPKPLIGRLQGDAFGGGIGLACVCDVAIAVDTAKFGLTETRLGLVPATIGPYVMARIGAAHARRVFMNSRVFSAQEAQTLGIVARVVSANALDAAIEAEVLPYLACAPGAVAEAKALVLALGGGIDQAAIDISVDALVTRWESGEASVGIKAFFDKKLPPWAQNSEN